MDDEIQPPPAFANRPESRIQRRLVGYVHVQQEIRSDRGRKRLHPLAERLSLKGKRQFGPLVGRRPGDAPGDGTVVGDPHHKPALALQKIAHQ